MLAPERQRERGVAVAGKPPSLRWTSWRFAVAAAFASVVVCVFCTFFIPELFGSHRWIALGDAPATINSAQYVANGGLPWVYSANAEWLPLPGFLLLLAPIVALGDHMGLVNNWPLAIPHPSLLVMVAPVLFLAGATAVIGVDYLADTLNVTLSRRRTVAAAVAFVVVVPTCLESGHAEDLLCLGLASVSLALLLRQRPGGAAAVLAVAILMQPWAILLVPLLVSTVPAGERLRTLVRTCALPTLTALVLFGMDFKDTWRSLVVQPMPDSHGQRLPWWALTHHTSILTDAGQVAVRVGSLPRTIAVLIAVGAAVFIHRPPLAQRVVAVAALALAARGAFETQLWPYYLGPGAVLLLLGAAAFAPPRSWHWPAAGAAALGFYGCVAGAYTQWTYPAPVALFVLIATGGVAFLAVLYRVPAPCARASMRTTNEIRNIERKPPPFRAKRTKAGSPPADARCASEARDKSKAVERRWRKATGPDVSGRGSAGLPGALGPASRTGARVRQQLAVSNPHRKANQTK